MQLALEKPFINYLYSSMVICTAASVEVLYSLVHQGKSF